MKVCVLGRIHMCGFMACVCFCFVMSLSLQEFMCVLVDICVILLSIFFGLHVYTLSHSTGGFDLCPGPSASRHNEHVVTGICGT